MPGFKASQDELGYPTISIARAPNMSSASEEYETQITLRYMIMALAGTIIAVIIGLVTYNLESERIEATTKRAEYDSYHHDGKVEADTLTLKGYIDNGTTQTWTMSKNGHAYKVTVERIPRSAD